MPKCVPADSLIDPQFLRYRMNLLSHQALSPHRPLPLSAHAGKHPIVGAGVNSFVLPFLEHVRQVRAHRDGFHTPSEPKQLALPKAGRRVHKDQDAG